LASHVATIVQATTNALLAHFFSLVCSLWLLRIVANRPSAVVVMATTAPSGAPRTGGTGGLRL
jgi:hypothetical protein